MHRDVMAQMAVSHGTAQQRHRWQYSKPQDSEGTDDSVPRHMDGMAGRDQHLKTHINVDNIPIGIQRHDAVTARWQYPNAQGSDGTDGSIPKHGTVTAQMTVSQCTDNSIKGHRAVKTQMTASRDPNAQGSEGTNDSIPRHKAKVTEMTISQDTYW